jgi:putative aldouronate transport system substrate-binding protein
MAPWQVFGSHQLVLDLPKNVPGARALPLAPIAGPDGSRGSYQETGFAFLTYIPKVAKNPEHAMRWINLKLEPEGFRKTTIGREGVHHTIEDGVFKPIHPAFQEEFGNGWWYLTGMIEKDYARYWLEVRLQRIPEMYDGFNQVQDLVSPYYKLDVTALAVGLDTYARNKSELQSMTRDLMIKVIAGAEPLSEIDNHLRKWRQAGGTSAKDELNNWYKTTYK